MSQTASVPSRWVSLALEEAVDIHDNLREPVNSKERSTRQGEYPYYGATGQVDWIDGYKCDGEYVLLGEDGAPFLDPSRPTAYLVRGRFWVNNHAHILKGKNGLLENRFLLHLLNSLNYRHYVSGTTRLKLTQGSMRKLPLVLPSIQEQHRIVAKLDELFSELNAGVAALERAQAKLKRYRASVLKAAVEGKLTEQWRRNNPPDETGEELLKRILVERRRRWEEEQLAKFKAKGQNPPKNWQQKYKEPVGPNTTELPELPEGWCWATVDQVGNVASGITKGGKKRDVTRRAVPYLRVANVQRGRLDLRVVKTILASDDEIRRYSLESGDVLFNEGGDRDKLGRGCVWCGDLLECLHQNHVFRVRPFLRDYSSEFLSHYGNSTGREWFYRRATQSVNLASINQTVLRSLPVPLPPLQEQKHVVRRLADILRSVEFAGTGLIRQLNHAACLRHSILKRAFEGRLVPQDPTDEPASVLLERIPADKQASRSMRPPTKPNGKRRNQVP